MRAITSDVTPGGFCGRVAAHRRLTHGFLICSGFEAWLMSLPVRVSIPRSAAVEPPFTHKGTELVGVVSGLVQVIVGSGRPVLRRGETLLATRRGIDGWRNVGDSDARCLWILRD